MPHGVFDIVAEHPQEGHVANQVDPSAMQEHVGDERQALRHHHRAGGEKSRLVVKAAGCGQPLGKNEIFKIGERNFTILKKLLWKNNVLLDADDVGGPSGRTVYFDVTTGEVKVSSNGSVSLL